MPRTRPDPLAERFPDGRFVWICNTCSEPREPGLGLCPRCGHVEFGLRLRGWVQPELPFLQSRPPSGEHTG
jgi:hypothetical protein